MVAKTTACLSYVNDPRAFVARNAIDQLAGDTRKKPGDFDPPLCSGNAVRAVKVKAPLKAFSFIAPYRRFSNVR